MSSTIAAPAWLVSTGAGEAVVHVLQGLLYSWINFVIAKSVLFEMFPLQLDRSGTMPPTMAKGAELISTVTWSASTTELPHVSPGAVAARL